MDFVLKNTIKSHNSKSLLNQAFYLIRYNSLFFQSRSFCSITKNDVVLFSKEEQSSERIFELLK